ncbi:MAG: hypothetical protein RRB13_02710 [bacterium]|nr:hypothetical protein [bacterium]
MKDIITQEDFDQLPDWVQADYKPTPQGEYAFSDYVPAGKLKELEEERDKHKAKVDEFRQNNVKLAKERDEAKDFALKGSGNSSDEMVAKLKDEYERQLESTRLAMSQLEQNSSAEKAQLLTQLEELNVTQRLTGAINQVGGLQEGALDILLGLGKSVFKMGEDGQVKPVDPSGGTLYDGVKPLDMEKWVLQQQAQRPFLFKGSSGGGAQGGGQVTHSGRISLEQVNGKTVSQEQLEQIAAGNIK